MRRVLPVLVLPLLLAAACAAPQAPGVQPTDGPAAGVHGADELVLRVEYRGGMTLPEIILARPPLVSVYADGRMVNYHQQEGLAYADEPALPDLRFRQLTPAGLDSLVRMAIDARLGDIAGLSILGATDGPYLHFTVQTSGGPREADLDPWLRDDPSGLSPEQQHDLARLAVLYDSLLDPAATLGADAGPEENPYVPAAVAVLNRPWGTGDPDRADRGWPGPALPGTATDWDVHCALAAGVEVAPVRLAAANAHVRTPWLWAGQRYDVTLRPLLPDESSCGDLPRPY